MLGESQSLQRRNMEALINRKGGIVSFSNVTRGDVEFTLDLQKHLDKLPEFQMQQIQNFDGSFPYMEGWDGPRT